MNCPSCGNSVESHFVACPICGTKLSARADAANPFDQAASDNPFDIPNEPEQQLRHRVREALVDDYLSRLEKDELFKTMGDLGVSRDRAAAILAEEKALAESRSQQPGMQSQLSNTGDTQISDTVVKGDVNQSRDQHLHYHGEVYASRIQVTAEGKFCAPCGNLLKDNYFQCPECHNLCCSNCRASGQRCCIVCDEPRRLNREAKRQTELEAKRQAEREAKRQSDAEAQRQAKLEAGRQAELTTKRQTELERTRRSETAPPPSQYLEANAYCLLTEVIARGDFATVYRAYHKGLKCEVAFKRMHPQFLADHRKLERFWQEVQLLASLEHPYIIPIYDVDRTTYGSLILQLMTGSLHDLAAGKPLDLDFLCFGLVCALQALKFLHANNILHGDVKPSNLLVDRKNRVKLGDFGLAHRATDSQGNLFKGTTKFIAPERVSDQFGPIGPASDLYSLGFSIYELMCGDQFDTLFPGLAAFGRDQQSSWMMWHAKPDWKAPEIGSVLNGVPQGFQDVVQRLVAKDQKVRYASADQAIRDIQADVGM